MGVTCSSLEDDTSGAYCWQLLVQTLYNCRTAVHCARTESHALLHAHIYNMTSFNVIVCGAPVVVWGWLRASRSARLVSILRGTLRNLLHSQLARASTLPL
ncbi:unnamed protein product [Leptosia nina]|uniref:Uncharacterized protein n=1 Tax=Leptosia nina TaxID=320188 RepID=A0AAV1JYP7_9NEOP